MKVTAIVTIIGVFSNVRVFGFISAPASGSLKEVSALMVSRRSLIDYSSVLSLAFLGVSTLSCENAWASGGATAGGVYLLSAKQRYNDRVIQGVQNFVALAEPLDSGNIESLRSFFTNEDAGSWKDFSSAGYLLANAFRRNSSAAPETLPSVKKWKAFAANVEGMTKSLKKKDTNGAKMSFEAALSSLDSYLVEVELPPAKEIAR